ncbi:5'-3' exonuclease H3TH domain-containing protein [Patescibacteria group bacterium]
MSKLVLIDGNAIMHRAYHALPPLTTKDGDPINAVYGLTTMLLRIISDLKPTHIAICFDRKEPTFRKKEFKAYQAHRPETEKELISQFSKAKDTVDSFGIPSYEKAGFEADDLIGTITKKTEKKLDRIIIVTGDKDILQLVTKKTSVYLPKRGLSDAQLMNPKRVKEKLGVTPEQIIDYKALVGDPSDNYPGVYGIGPKTAESLLSDYGNYKTIYKNLNKIPETTRKKLKNGKSGGDTSFKLAKIVTNVSFKYDLAKMSKWEVGNQKTISLFESYGFKTLTGRIKVIAEEKISKDQMKLV